MTDHTLNAAHNPNEPRNKYNHARFGKLCRRSGLTISDCFKYRDQNDQNQKPPQNCEYFSDNYNRRLRHPEENSWKKQFNKFNPQSNTAEHIAHILDSLIMEQILSIDLDLKVLNQEKDFSIKVSTIKITQTVRICLREILTTIIKIRTEALLYPT